eukprot:1180465-Prorocentrum_minimum.AAC.1
MTTSYEEVKETSSDTKTKRQQLPSNKPTSIFCKGDSLLTLIPPCGPFGLCLKKAMLGCRPCLESQRLTSIELI